MGMTDLTPQPGFPRNLDQKETEALAAAFAEKHRVMGGIVIPIDVLTTIIADTEMVVLGQMPIRTWTDNY